MRTSEQHRKTRETDITVKLNLDGSGKTDINSGNGFFNHMLELFASHARFDLTVKCKGDTHVDFHHSVEDIGITLGKAMNEALGTKVGISRYGNAILPMDEALVLTAVDFSGRSFLKYHVVLHATKLHDEAKETNPTVGDFDAELVEEFLHALTRSGEMTLHVKMLDGKNSHHIVEAIFKSLGRSIRKAVSKDGRYEDEIPSTKGTI